MTVKCRLTQFIYLTVVVTGKNPDVDTSFLPDRDREEEDARLRCGDAWA